MATGALRLCGRVPRQAERVFVFWGRFRPTTLTGYRNEAGALKKTRGLSRQARETLTLQLLYRALPRREIQNFAACPDPGTFAVMYDTMKVNLDLTLQGVFGDYGIKLMLDMLVMTGGVPCAALSRWPTNCPGYHTALATLFPRLPPAERLKALYWVHRELSTTWRFEFPESCAQLCWWHRRRTG